MVIHEALRNGRVSAHVTHLETQTLMFPQWRLQPEPVPAQEERPLAAFGRLERRERKKRVVSSRCHTENRNCVAVGFLEMKVIKCC